MRFIIFKLLRSSYFQHSLFVKMKSIDRQIFSFIIICSIMRFTMIQVFRPSHFLGNLLLINAIALINTISFFTVLLLFSTLAFMMMKYKNIDKKIFSFIIICSIMRFTMIQVFRPYHFLTELTKVAFESIGTTAIQ